MGPYSFLLGLLLVGVAVADSGHFSTWNFEEIDSEEFGQFKGPKSTNCSCGATNKANGRIVGGRVTKVNEYPHMAGIAKNKPGKKLHIFCGSTIVTPHHLLTAAHCTHDLRVTQDIVVLVGGHHMHGGDTRHSKVYNVVLHKEHEKYDPESDLNDIAILLVAERITFGEAVGPACLPVQPATNLVGQYVKVTGWGDTEYKGYQSDVLQKVNLRVVPLDQCAQKYRGLINPSVPTQFCTFRPNKDSCQGDSGGPVTWLDPETNRYTLVGVVSYGRGCASDAPGVNTDIFAYMPWIQAMITRTTAYTESKTIGARTCSKLN